MNQLYHRTYETIWKPRCNDMIAMERRMGIDKKTKRLHSSYMQSATNNNSNLQIHSTWNVWITLTINQGGHWTDF